MTGELVILTGPPGAGKSTVAALVVDARAPSALVEGDAFFAFVRRGRIEPWLTAAHQQNEMVTQAAAAATGGFVRGGAFTVYDGVVGPWFLPTFLTAAGLTGAHYLVLLPDLATVVRRVATRVGHGFTDETAARHMYAQFADATIDRRHVIPAMDHDPATVADDVMARVATGTARVTSPGGVDPADDHAARL